MATPNTPSDFLAHIQAKPSVTPQEYREIRTSMPDIAPIFDAFKGRMDVTTNDIESYMLDVQRPLNPFEHHLFKIILKIKEEGIEEGERDFNKNTIQSLAHYINQRNSVILESETDLHNLHSQVKPKGMSEAQIPAIDPIDIPGKLRTGTKELIRAYSETESILIKGALLTGLAASLFLAYYGAKYIFTSKNTPIRYVRNLLGLGVTALVANHMMARTLGRPFMTWDKDIGRQPIAHYPFTDKEWNETVYKQQLENAVSDLKTKHVDDAFLKKMLGTGGTPNDVRYVKGITNFGTLSVREFLDIYERSRGANQVSDTDWPNYPCSDSIKYEQHNLKPAERFAIMEEMAKTLELVDATGEVKTDIQEEELNESVFVKILNRP